MVDTQSTLNRRYFMTAALGENLRWEYVSFLTEQDLNSYM